MNQDCASIARLNIRATPTITPVLLSILMIFASAALEGCSFGKSRQVAAQAVDQFHKQLDAEQYDQIYANASEEFRKSGSLADLNDLLAAVHRKLGTVKSTHETGFFVNTTTMGTSARVQYDTEFSDGKASESFIFMVSGDKATLVRYDINSPTLVTK